MKRIIEYIYLFIILIIGFLLRAQETLSHNFLFLIDQGRDMMAVRNIVYGHHLTLIGPYTSLQGVFQGPLWYYLLAIPTYIFHGDPWGAVVLMLLISMTVLFVDYFYMKKFFGMIAALLTCFVFALSPEATAAATYSWNPHPMWLLIVFYIFVFYKILLGKSKFHLLLWPIIALLFHFETALGVFFLIGTIFYFILFARSYFLQRYIWLGMVVSGVFFLPQVIFDLRHNFLMTRSVLSIFTGSKQGLFAKGEHLQYSQLISNHWGTIVTNYNSSFVHDGVFAVLPGIIFIFIAVYLLISFIVPVFEKKEKIFLNLQLRLLALFFVLSFLYPFPLRYWFLTGFQSFYLIILGFLLSKLWKFKIGKFLVLLFVLVYLLYLPNRINTLYFHPPNDGGTAKIKGKEAAIEWVYHDAQSKPFSLLVFTPPVNTDAYDYLVWLESKKFGFLPTKEKKGTFYLLMEPDPDKPWSYKGWMDTVIKTGTIEKTVILPSGFIIQKRIANEKI